MPVTDSPPEQPTSWNLGSICNSERRPVSHAKDRKRSSGAESLLHERLVQYLGSVSSKSGRYRFDLFPSHLRCERKDSAKLEDTT